MRTFRRFAGCAVALVLIVPATAAATPEVEDVTDLAEDLVTYGTAGKADGILSVGGSTWSLSMSFSDIAYGAGSLGGSGTVTLVPGTIEDWYQASGSGYFSWWDAPEITWSLPNDARATGIFRLSYDVPQTGGGFERRTLHGVLHADGWWLGRAPPDSFQVHMLYTSP